MLNKQVVLYIFMYIFEPLIMKRTNNLNVILSQMLSKCPLVFALLIVIACSNEKKKNKEEPPLPPKKKVIAIIYQDVLPIEDFNDERVTKDKFYSGTKSLYMPPAMEFSSGFKHTIGKIENFKSIDSLEISLMNYSIQKLKGIKVVFTIDDEKGKNLIWNGNLIENKTTGTWEKFKQGFKLDPSMIQANHIINIYVWNEGKEELWIDDFEITMFGRILPQAKTVSLNSNLYYDFEQIDDLQRAEKLGESIARSGKMTCNLSDGSEYGIGVKRSFKDFGDQKIKKLSASVWVYPTEKNHDLVLTFSSVNKKNGELNFWHGKSTLNGEFPLNQWTILNSAIDLPVEKYNLEDEVEVGIWNKGKTSILCDDLHIVYGAPPEKRSKSNEVEVDKTSINSSVNVSLVYNYLNFDQTKINGLNQIEPQSVLVNGCFYKPNEGLESILQINKFSASMWWYHQKNKHFEKIWETNDKNNFLLIPNNFVATGDFDGDNIADLLQVNKTDFSWKLYHFESKEWTLKMTGTQAFPEKWLHHLNQISVSSQMNSKHKSVLLQVIKHEIQVLQLENGQWVSSSFGTNKNGFIFKENDLFMDWNNKTFLKLNTQWRFDLKQVQINKDDVAIKCNFDFQKDEKGSNPKYYEQTKILSGNFLSVKSKQLLVCYFNCLNNNFTGNNCNGIENNDDFPNGISFYY